MSTTFNDIQARRIEDLAEHIAATQVEWLDELALIGYPDLPAEIKALYQVSLRLAAISVMDRVLVRAA